MRRVLTLVFLLFLAVPAGITISGCYRNPAGNYCNGLGYGLKVTDVYSITLTPQNTGISMAFGQTRQINAPTAINCKSGSVSVTSYTYGTSNNRLLDISPTGNMCAGTWNRNSGGGIPDYTVCNYPNPLPSSNGLPFGSAYITAAADSVTSNPVQVFVHAPVTSISLVAPQQCLSQSETAQLDAEACYSGANNAQYELCAPSSVTTYACKSGLAPGVTSVPTCSSSIGTLAYTAQTTSIATINQQTNQITAEQPGTTAITASLAGSGSSAGYFSTCPPQSISVTYNGGTSGTVTKGVTQNLVTTVTDTHGNQITGLSLDYQSTNPQNLSIATGGAVTASFPGSASVYAICQPSTCNSAPINKIGAAEGTGLPISSNAVNLTVPGTATTYAWLGSPGQSQYFVQFDPITGTVGSTVRLPYVPNSMVMDRDGNNLYFGSSHELMIYSTSNNSLTTQNTSVPGVVLAVAPNNSSVLVNDQVRQLFYVVNTSASTVQTFTGIGTAAEWTPDSKTLYVTDSASAGAGHTNTLYVYNSNTGWTTYALSTSGGATGPRNLAITIPGVGAYITGSPTVAHTWCPTGTTGDYASLSFYPQGDSVNTDTDVLTATTDGMHILGAAAQGGSIAFSDIGVSIPGVGTLKGACPKAINNILQPLLLTHTLNQTTLNVNATAVNQIVSSPAAVSQGTNTASYSLSFITYNGATAGATLPYYKQTTGTTSALGTVGYLTFTGGSSITAPIVGAFSPDNTTFFVSTGGDNLIHAIDTGTLKDTQQINPNLPACNPTDQGCTLTTPSANPVPATVITVKPRATT